MSPDAIDIARDFISRWEGMELHKYRDSAGLWTIGVGHLILDYEDFSEGVMQDEALDLLEKDMYEAVQCIEMNVDVECNDEQYASLISLCFNIGCKAFIGSTLLKLLNDNKFDAASKQFLRCDHAGGKRVKGLTNRREAEMRLFLGQV